MRRRAGVAKKCANTAPQRARAVCVHWSTLAVTLARKAHPVTHGRDVNGRERASDRERERPWFAVVATTWYIRRAVITLCAHTALSLKRAQSGHRAGRLC
jgi:hypothetical protein